MNGISLNGLQACPPAVTRLFLVRHGEVEGHGEPRYNGQQDVPLTEKGRQQYGQLVKRLRDRPVRAVYSSDLSRCVEGAEMLAAAYGLQPVALRQFREIHAGAWEGRPWRELQERYPRQWQARLDDVVHYRIPGGENLLEALVRVRHALGELLMCHRGEEVVLVSHGGINRLLLLDALGASLERVFSLSQFYACLNIIDYRSLHSATVHLCNG